MSTPDENKKDELVALATALAAESPKDVGSAQADDALGVGRQRMKSRLMARVNARSPQGTTTIKNNLSDADRDNWEPFLEGVTRKLLLADDGSGVETALYRLQPGHGFPEHTHTHTEECWVLEGEVLVGDYTVSAGDMHIAHSGFTHDQVIARTPSVLLIRSQVY